MAGHSCWELLAVSNVKRRVYQDNDEYTANLEEQDGILFVHVNLKTFDKGTISTLRVEFDKLKRKLYQAGYEWVYSYSATPKLYRMFKGVEEIGTMTFEGKQYEVLRWKL